MTSKPPTDPAVNAARREYARRMNRVLNYIDGHLDEALDGEQLADIANFSRFHFHRIFAAWMGETVGQYARRRRLEKAAFRLSCGSDESVLETALATGFGSGEAFARAFKIKFGCTPSEWRAGTRRRVAAQAAAHNSNPDQVVRKFDQAGGDDVGQHERSSQLSGEHNMEVRIVDLPEVNVAYQRLIGPYGPAIGAFWRSTMAPWMQSHGLMGHTCYGIGHDDPTITPPDKCRYDACVEVPDGFGAGGQAELRTLPGGRYAVTAFKGKPPAIAEAWMRLTREWLPSSGLQCDDRPCFEMFSSATGMDPVTGEFSCDICIPVRAL
ncbi:MAG: AraC family transcriptional regulator [Massilia sp.]